MKRAGLRVLAALAISVVGMLVVATTVYGDSLTATGASDVKDGFLYQPYPANNYGGDVRVILGKGSSSSYFRQFLWFARPDGTNSNVVCTLAIYLSTLSANPDTFDLFWCTRPNARLYVGNNSGAVADSAEMDWERFFNNGSNANPSDTAWRAAGGDFTTNDTLSRKIIPGGSSVGWYYWVLDSAQVDSLLRGTRENYGVFVKGRASSSAATRTEGASTESSNSSLRPWVKFVYNAVGASGVSARRREILQP